MNKITALFSLLITSYIQVYSQEFSKVYTAQTPIEPLDLTAKSLSKFKLAPFFDLHY